MTGMMKRLILTCLTAVGLFGCNPTGPGEGLFDGPRDGTFGILFLGNSLTYTNNLPAIVAALLSDSGAAPVSVGAVAFPNYGLQDHWVDRSSRAAVEAGWDLVIMQQGPSATEGRPSLLEFSRRFATEIRAAGGEPALYMVWPSVARDFDFDGVSDSYAAAADSVDGLLFPAGEAWRAAWRRNANLSLYGPDGFHPRVMGTYLAALVIYEQIADSDLGSLPLSTPETLGLFTAPDSVVRMLHEAAAEANDTFARRP